MRISISYNRLEVLVDHGAVFPGSRYGTVRVSCFGSGSDLSKEVTGGNEFGAGSTVNVNEA